MKWFSACGKGGSEVEPSLKTPWSEERQTHLFEGELDGLVLAQLQDVHELHDGFVTAVQLVLSLDELFLLFGEVDELVQSFLVDVAVFLQLRVALLQFPEQLWELEKKQRKNKLKRHKCVNLGKVLGFL